MLDKKEFAKIRAELKSNEKRREGAISLSREAIRMSKLIIYAIHRGDLPKAESLMGKIKAMVKKLPSSECGTGMRNVALQEYVEAAALFSFAKLGKVPSASALGVDTESYLLGLCDLSGEVVRMAVNSSINGKYDDVFKIKELVEEIYGEFLQFDLRGGELRKKSDQIKWALQKIEDIVFDIKKLGKI